jgi:nitrate reductase NapE component
MTNPREPAKNNPQQNEKNKNQVNIKSVHPPKPVKKTPARVERKAQVEVDHAQQKAADRKNNMITFSILTAVVLIAVAVTVFLVGILPMQRSILTVDNENVKTSYYLKRVVATSNRDPNSTLQSLVNELTIKEKGAAEGVTPVTSQDIDTFLRNEAKGTNDTISDADFDKWFKQQLSATGLSSSDYRDIISREIQQQRLSDILSAKVSDSMPQIHLWWMVFSSQDSANAIKTKVDGGTDFTTIAADSTTTGWVNGGDQGWMPLSIINAQLQSTVTTLDVNKCSAPVSVVQSSDTSGTNLTTRYVLLWISEKSDSMKVTADQLTTLKNQALSDWERTKQAAEKITVHGLNGATSLDSATLTWINSKVARLVSKLPKITPTTTPATTTTTAASTTTTTVTTTPATSTTGTTTTTGTATTTGTTP